MYVDYMLEDKHYMLNQCLLNVVITYWFAWQLGGLLGDACAQPLPTPAV